MDQAGVASRILGHVRARQLAQSDIAIRGSDSRATARECNGAGRHRYITGGLGGEPGKPRPYWILVALQGFEPRTCGL